MTDKFAWLLSIQTGPDGKRLTQESWGQLLGIGRTRLCQALGNVKWRGAENRPLIAADIVERFGKWAEPALKELGWDAQGNLIAPGTFHGEQNLTVVQQQTTQ